MYHTKKIILALVFCFFGYASSAQTVSAEVIYTASLEVFYKHLVSSKNNSAKYFLPVVKAAHNIEYKLFANKNIALFKLIEGMAIGDKNDVLKIAVGLAGRGKYYTNLQTGQQLTVKNNYGQDYNILGSIEKHPWELTKTTKKIGNFTCYKATYIKKLPKRNYTVVAWYTPQIPLPFGPLDHGGNLLPGLILELHLPMASYYAKSVTLNPKNQPQITWPTNIHTISKEKYRQQGEVVLKAIKN